MVITARLRQRLTQSLHLLGKIDSPAAAVLGTHIMQFLTGDAPMPEPEEPPVAPEPETIPRSPNAYVYVDEVTGVVMNTLHTLERGAQVNAIYLASMGKIMPRADWTDDHIREVFDAAVGQRGAIRPVFVEVLE